ncbi:MAG TPA: DNA-binding domain-containing protein, partial [Rhizomicrobium sp.]|nr:DNA-binding domain-containing protein [Rhizomicrobium sp.]
MLSLAEFQYNIAADILDGGARTLSMLPGDGEAARVALSVHRNTVLTALVNALRLTYPTADELVGARFFDQVALAYARSNPPRGASLSDYGDGFPDFLADYAPARDVDCLAD